MLFVSLLINGVCLPAPPLVSMCVTNSKNTAFIRNHYRGPCVWSSEDETTHLSLPRFPALRTLSLEGAASLTVLSTVPRCCRSPWMKALSGASLPTRWTRCAWRCWSCGNGRWSSRSISGQPQRQAGGLPASSRREPQTPWPSGKRWVPELASGQLWPPAVRGLTAEGTLWVLPDGWSVEPPTPVGRPPPALFLGGHAAEASSSLGPQGLSNHPSRSRWQESHL